MNITSLAYLASLLLPATALAETPPPVPPHQSSDTTSRDDHEIIRRYSIYTGLKTAAETQQDIRNHVARNLIDPQIMRQSLLDHLDKPVDTRQLDEELQRSSKLHTKAILEEETARDKTFMQENAKRPGVVSLPIGIQYEVIPDSEGNNRQLANMDCFIRSTTIGRQLDKKTSETTIRFGNEPSRPPDFSDQLPNILQNTSALQNMPKGGKYIFYVPANLLSSSERERIGSAHSIIVYTYCQAKKDDTFRHTRHTRIPDNLLRQYAELLGARTSQYINLKLHQQDIDSTVARQTFLDHLDRPVDPASLQDEYKNIIRQYETIHQTRQAARDRNFIKENARKPGVVVLENGIQYTVEKDPGGNNIPFTQSTITKRASISGEQISMFIDPQTKLADIFSQEPPGTEISICMTKENITDCGMPDMLGDALARVATGRKWVFYIPFALLPETQQENLNSSWDDKCPEYIVHTFEADQKTGTPLNDDATPPKDATVNRITWTAHRRDHDATPPKDATVNPTGKSSPPSDKDGDIEDDAPANPDDSQNFLWKKDRTAESMALDEALFLRLNDLTPNVTILPNGVRYSYITDPDEHNGSIKNVSTMMPQTLAGDSFLSHDHLNIKTTRADGTPIYTHPLIEPYVDDVPEAKKWFFCIPSELIDPESMDWYTQRIGVRPNYILYILKADTQP